MKKTIFLITLTALLCSCAAEPAETTATMTAAPAETTTTTAATEEPVQTTPETDQGEPETDQGEPEADQGEPETDRGERLSVNVNPSCFVGIDPADLYFYENEWTSLYGSDDYRRFDYTYVFGASVYDDSTLHPERFNLENGTYKPETKYAVPKPFKVKAGDTVGDYRICSAQTMTSRMGGNKEVQTIDVTEVVLDGEYSFTGVLRFFYNEKYPVGAGGLWFLPSEPLKSFPIPIGFGAHPSFFSENTAVYSELTDGFFVGNLFTGESGVYTYTGDEENRYAAIKLDESVLAALNRMLSEETGNCEKRVEVTLRKITLTYGTRPGGTQKVAVITGIKEIK